MKEWHKNIPIPENFQVNWYTRVSNYQQIVLIIKDTFFAVENNSPAISKKEYGMKKIMLGLSLAFVLGAQIFAAPMSQDAGDKMKSGIKTIGKGAKDLGKGTAEGAKSVAKATVKGTKRVGKKTKRVVKKGVKKVGEGTEKAGTKMKKVGN